MKKARIRSKHRAGSLGTTQADRDAMRAYLENQSPPVSNADQQPPAPQSPKTETQPK